MRFKNSEKRSYLHGIICPRIGRTLQNVEHGRFGADLFGAPFGSSQFAPKLKSIIFLHKILRYTII